MGKKRKATEISEDERIQTVVVRDPYGWNDPNTWTPEDRKRNDNGLYVCVEWLEHIFGGLGAPGSLTQQRHLGPAIQELWYWPARNELLASIRKDIDISPQLGRHVHAKFLKEPPSTNANKYSLVLPSKHRIEEQITRGGEGWKGIPNVPMVEVSSIRRRKFVSPYPSPNVKKGKLPAEGILDENTGEHKPRVKEETKRTIHKEIKREGIGSIEKASDMSVDRDVYQVKRENLDIKPDLRAIDKERGVNETVPSQAKSVKTEELSSSLGSSSIKREQESLDSILARGRARLNASANEDALANNDPRPTKRLKPEQD
ncbi:hypothetical protein CPB86DRAFT_781756 [Serendipita vermifera]|nr:hypothetical protein CPB86DRAFT_781756 [Serendipita vermifera]